MTELPAAVNRAEAEGTSLAVVVADIDHFKSINDRYGHDAGDAVLVQVATTLCEATRAGVLARYGGEEFVLVMAGIDGLSAMDRTNSLRRLLSACPVAVDGVCISVTFSACVAAYVDGQSPEDLIRNADIALYSAKDHGRNRVELAAGHVTAA